MSRRSVVAAGAALALSSGALAFRRADAAWAAAHDDVPPDDRLLPAGELRIIPTDDGAELAVTLAGPLAGPLVVLAHGFTNGREVWAPVAHRLIRDGCRVALYDQRGHGSSTSGAEGHTIDRLGRDLAELLTELDARDAVLVGHSMGGMTIQSFAAHHPSVVAERVRGLVLVATAAHGISKGNQRGDRIAARAVGGAGLDRFLRTGVGHAFFRNVFGATVRKVDLVLARELFLSTPGAARSAFVDAMLRMDLREANAGIDVPTTVVIGARDRLLPPHLGKEVAASISGARLVRLEHVGHMLPLEAAAEVADAVLETVRIGRSERSLA